jgi:hypothetical protein
MEKSKEGNKTKSSVHDISNLSAKNMNALEVNFSDSDDTPPGKRRPVTDLISELEEMPISNKDKIFTNVSEIGSPDGATILKALNERESDFEHLEAM